MMFSVYIFLLKECYKRLLEYMLLNTAMKMKGDIRVCEYVAWKGPHQRKKTQLLCQCGMWPQSSVVAAFVCLWLSGWSFTQSSMEGGMAGRRAFPEAPSEGDGTQASTKLG